MEYKRLIVLANSMKKDGRCVAGRMLSTETPPSLLGWCRPISDKGEGELSPRHMTIEGNPVLTPLDVVDVPVARYASNAAHPEDWIVSGGKWKPVKTLPSKVLPRLVEAPESLWLEDANHSDRVSPAFFQHANDHQSLHLIRPSNLRLRLWREFNQYKGYNQKKTRVLFRQYIDRHKTGAYLGEDGKQCDVPIICEAATVYRTSLETIKMKLELMALGVTFVGREASIGHKRGGGALPVNRFKQRKRRR
ncbi:MAG: hypothetical protein HEQ23_12745 [Tepidisphaera sp.]